MPEITRDTTEPGWSNAAAADAPDPRAKPEPAPSMTDPGWSNSPPDDGISATEPPPVPIDMWTPGWSNAVPPDPPFRRPNLKTGPGTAETRTPAGAD
jgi:hypothetical protein